MISLSQFTKRKRAPLTPLQIKQIKKWILDDWESHDMDRNAVVLIERLLVTVDPNIFKSG